MTEDTIFDMASLTKVIVTTTAIGQLYEGGKLDFDTPLDHYLPDFNPTHDPTRAQVTLRLLLTHTSGEPPDVNLKDSWGLASPDKAEGLHRALTTPLASTPGTKMVYSDINFILLGALVEKLSGEPLNLYAARHIFSPLGMTATSYHLFAAACGSHKTVGAAIYPAPKSTQDLDEVCGGSGWFVNSILNTAPTAHDDEGTPTTNPDFNHLLRGTVHDPTARRMGGVAGHAGVFSTAHDMSLFAQALLDRYAGRPSTFPLKQKTLILMSVPQQPGHTPFQLGQHFRANAKAIVEGQKSATGDPNLLDPNFPAIKDEPLRGFGWDIDSAYSKPRGRLPIGSFGHTGFTGTSLWLDPGSDTFILLLANAIHPHPGAPISNLRGEVATAAMLALNLYPDASPTPTKAQITHEPGAPSFAQAKGRVSSEARPFASPVHETSHNPGAPHLASEMWVFGAPRRLKQVSTESATPATEKQSPDKDPPSPPTLTGIDVLEATGEQALLDLAQQHGRKIKETTGPDLRIGLLTNQTGLDRNGNRTIDFLNSARLRENGLNLTTLFSPEHGIFGQQDTEHLTQEADPSTHLPMTSLYGPHDSDRRPSHTQLANLDAVLIDLQDAGLRDFTYETVVGYFLEAAATERTQYHHNLAIIVLDRPNPLGGLTVNGPPADPGTESYINYQPIFQHGLTLGEFARYIAATKHLEANLTVIPMQNWRRTMLFDDTGLPWTPPSPNLHTPTANLLYPATTMLEFTDLSVGRGTPLAFEVFGAPSPINKPGAPSSRPTGAKVGSPANESQPLPQSPTQPKFNAQLVADTLNARNIPGAHFHPIQLTIPEDKNHYPGHGQTIPAVHISITDRTQLNAAELGLELLSTLHNLYPTQFHLEKASRILCNRATLDALTRGDDPRTIADTWTPTLNTFKVARTPFLLYEQPSR